MIIGNSILNYTKFVRLTTNLFKLKQIYISNNLMNVKRCLKTSIFRAILQKQGIIDIFLSPPKYWPLLKRTLKYRTHHFPSCNKMPMRIISRMIMTTMIMTTRMNRLVFCLDARVSATTTHLLTWTWTEMYLLRVAAKLQRNGRRRQEGLFLFQYL